MTIPSWAHTMVSNYREALSIPNAISDEEIFRVEKECSGMDREDILEAMKDEFNLRT